MEQAKIYLKLLDPNAKKFLFACFDYRKINKGRTYYGSFDSSVKQLKDANDKNYCIYVTVNETKAGERKKESITRARAIWVEDDKASQSPRTDWPIKPSMIVESSPNKYHYYWMTSTKKFDEWDAVMETMVTKHGCDNKAKDLARVLRLPDFIHKKDVSKPFTTRIVESTGDVYSWLAIKAAFPPAKPEPVSSAVRTPGKYSEKDTLDSLLKSDNYHGSLTSIAMSLSNRGVSRDLQYNTLFGLMNAIPVSARRPEWEARASKEHLYECIDSAISKVKKEYDDDKIELVDNDDDKDPDFDNFDFPPGNLGRLCQEIYEMAPYQNKAIALSGGLGLVAGIVGRKYNIMGMGLNLYIAILADSGIGKANLKDSINIALRSSGGNYNSGATFVGRSRFTGPKAIFDMLTTGMSRICVMEEAGLINESTAGDQAGISRATLDLFTSSGFGKFAGDEGYSNKDNSIPAIHSPALSIISVSTPKSFLRALKNKQAEVSGEVARLWMLRSNGDKPFMNRKRRHEYSRETIKILGDLIKICSQVQLPENEFKVTNVKFDENYFNDADDWVRKENKYKKSGDNLRRTLCSRAFAKIMKLSAIASIFNGKDTVGDEEYQWASKCVEKELEFIQTTFTHESSDSLEQVTKTVVAKAIRNILNNKFTDIKKQPPIEMTKRNMFSSYNLSQCLKNNHVIKDLDDDPAKQNPKTGVEKVLGYMMRQGWVTHVDDLRIQALGLKKKNVYMITPDFKYLLSDD